MDHATRAILDGRPVPLIFKFTAPNALAFTLQATVNLAEIWIIGGLGTAALAAIALSFPMSILLQTMSGGALGGGISSAVARALGNGDTARAERILWHALYIGTALAVLFFILFHSVGRQALSFLGGTGAVLDDAFMYCSILFSGGVFIWLSAAISAIFRGAGDMAYPARLMIIASFVQVPLTACLVLGLHGLPALGMPGAALSFVLMSAFTTSLMLRRVVSARAPVRLRRACMQLDVDVLREIFRVTLPASLNPILNVGTILGLTALVGRFGPSALAGYGIGTRIEFVVLPVMFAFGTAATTLVGTNIGAGQQQRAEHIAWYAVGCAAFFCGVIGTALAIFPELWVPFFSQDPVAIQTTTKYIQIVGPAYAFYGVGLVLYFASQGAGAMRWPIITQILRFVVAVGGSWLAINLFDADVTAIFVVSTISLAIYASVLAGSVYLGAWRQKT